MSPDTEFKKGQPSNMKGTYRSVESIEKQKETIRNRSEERRKVISKNISESARGRHNSILSEFKKGQQPWNKGKKYTLGVHKTIECKRIVSEKLIGHPLYRPKRSELKYKEHAFRSSWELAFAKYLDSIREPWEYESKQFHLGDMTYTPDFYLTKFDLYIEIKGFWQRGYREKFEKFKQHYPNTDIVVLEHCPPYELPNLFKHTDMEI